MVADSISGNTAISTTNESITITTGTGTTANADVTGVTFFGNSTNTTDSSAIGIGSEVNFTTAGAITVAQDLFNGTSDNQSIFSDGSYNIVYSYEGSLYVANTTSRTLLKLIVIFFALGVIAIAFIMVRKSFPDLF